MAYQPQHFPNVVYMPVLTCNGSGCTHSSACPVSHLVNAHPVSNGYDPVASGLPLSPISNPLSPSIEPVPCLFFARNRCSKGETCSFSHDVSKPDVNRPCKYFLQGSCRNRESCRFFHASVDAPSTAPATPDFTDNNQRGLEETSGLNVTTTSTTDSDGSVATADNGEPIPLSEPAFNLDDFDPSLATTTNPDEREPFEIPLPPSRDELSPANRIPDGADEVLSSSGARSVKQEESPPDLFPFSQNATSFEPCTFRMTGRCIRESCIVHHDGPVESVFSPIPSQHSPLLADLDDGGKGDWVQFSEAAITQAADHDSPVNYTGEPQTICNMGFDHSSVPSPPTPTPPPLGPCKYFALGNCRKNNDCPFVHDIRAQPRMPYRSDRMANTSSRPGVCRNHQAGRCWRGSNCRFRHDVERRSPSPRPVYTDIHKSSEEEGSGWLASTDPWGTSDWTTGNEAWGSGNVEPEKSSQLKPAYSEPEANDKSYLDGWSSDFEDASKGVVDGPSAVSINGAQKDAAAVDLPDHTASDTAPVTSQSSGGDDVPVTDWYEEVEQSEHAHKQRQDDWGAEPQPMGHANAETVPSNDSSVDGTVCLFFMKGICNQGEKCIYSHIEPDSSNIKLCHFFARGLCKSGDKCLYSHSQPDSSDVKLCHFFARGLCKNGDACSYFHDKSDSVPAETLTLQDESAEANQDEADSGWLQQTDPWGTDTNATDWATAGVEGWANAKSADDPDMEDSWAVPQTPRPQPFETETPAPSPEPERDFPPQPIYDCLVRFGSGAIPEELVTKFESSTLRLSGYPYGMSHDDLVQLASPYGVVKNTTFNVTPGGLQAHIEFENSIQAAAARANLNGLQIVNDEETVCIHAQLDCAGSVAGSVLELETARQLQLVWDAPSVSAWAFYATVGIAKHESDRLMGMTYGCRKITAQYWKPKPGQKDSFAVRLYGLPHDVKREALHEFCARSSSVSLNPPNYRDPPNSQILNSLGNFGHVESFRVLPIDASDLEVTAFVEFTKAEAAKTARLALKAMKHEFLGNTCIRAQSIVYTAYNCLACPPAAFNLVRDALEPLSTDISTVRHTTQPLQVHIFGRPSAVDVVERNKQSVQNLLFGREMPGVWDPCFDTSTGEEAFRRINNNLTFHVRPDRGRQVLRIWGNSSDAEKQITRLLKVVEAKRHSISLADACMPPLVRGELAEIQDTFGASKVLLDAHKQTLIVVGDDAKKAEVENRLETLVSCHSGSLPEPGDCSFCYGDILEPVQLSCGHVYCSECLVHVVRPVPGVAFTSPVCINQTENSRCLAPIPLPTILARLSDTDRTTLLESALLSFVRSDPNFQFCPAGCPVVYRSGDKGTVYTCSHCNLELCASCVNPMHAGSCTEQEITQSQLEPSEQI